MKLYFDPELVVPDDELPLREGAIAPWANLTSPYYDQTLDSLARHYKVSTNTPWQGPARRMSSTRSCSAPATSR